MFNVWTAPPIAAICGLGWPKVVLGAHSLSTYSISTLFGLGTEAAPPEAMMTKTNSRSVKFVLPLLPASSEAVWGTVMWALATSLVLGSLAVIFSHSALT